VATYHCKDVTVDAGQKAKCIQNKAISYIKEAAGKLGRRSTAKDFTKQLKRIFDRVGGNPNKPSPDSLASTTDNSFLTLDPAACAADKSLQKLEGCSSNASANCDKFACDLVQKYVNPTIEVLSLIFGLIAAISIIVGGIQYTSSAGDPQKITTAKHRIVMTLTAVLAYTFLVAFLEFLVPGGFLH
jgi:hypothetical protein